MPPIFLSLYSHFGYMHIFIHSHSLHAYLYHYDVFKLCFSTYVSSPSFPSCAPYCLTCSSSRSAGQWTLFLIFTSKSFVLLESLNSHPHSLLEALFRPLLLLEALLSLLSPFYHTHACFCKIMFY